ncbi:tyrosine-type recombinase/integrase [Acinetobacter indicus]|uniref:tyrosine-type recombinase/integrase n=1 Tax=Acinetobacter indicus TaxID=756892 RepID=UPI0013625539|nr:tyrosine-type recombinase/integrase [Acinetobacter indicus]
MKRDAIKKRPLSDTTLAGLEAEEKEYRELDGNGLYFRVQASGKKSWQFRYKKSDGKWSWLGLGTYPSTPASTARKKAAELMEKISKGEVIQTKADIQQQQADEASLMFSVLMNDWLATKRPSWDSVTYDKAVKSIERHIIPAFGHRDFTQIEPQEWLDFFHSLQRDLGIYTQTEKLTSYCRSAYNLAKFRKKIKFNPLEGITEFLDSGDKGNMKHVGLEELPNLIRAIRKHPSRPIAIGLELLALLFPRPSELREAVWAEFDLDKAEWVKPAERMKTGIIHAVPLPRQAIALLKELETYRTESEFLFPSRDSLDRPISNMTFNVALNRMGYKNRQNPHGFRHIASTELNRQFSDKAQVVEAALAHLKKGIKGKYDKGTHFEERVEMMQWWADELDRMVG